MFPFFLTEKDNVIISVLNKYYVVLRFKFNRVIYSKKR